MLLRSSSSPLLNSLLLPSSGDGCCSHADLFPLVKPHHVAVAAQPSSPSSTPRSRMISRAMSESDLSALAAVPKKRSNTLSVEEVDDEEGADSPPGTNAPPSPAAASSSSLRRLLYTSGLDTGFAGFLEAAAGATAVAEPEVGGGFAGGAGGGSGRISGGGGRRDKGGADGASAAMDAHYRAMIEADPGNGLLLGNYAKFLKEVVGDVTRAQEYCERTILANPGDGQALSLYAGIVWETSRDEERADSYYHRAIEAAPDDCYVLGSYAGFLWDAEEEEVVFDSRNESSSMSVPPLPAAILMSPPPIITAAS